MFLFVHCSLSFNPPVKSDGVHFQFRTIFIRYEVLTRGWWRVDNHIERMHRKLGPESENNGIREL